MDKSAQTNYPIHDILKKRWSPRAFSAQPVARETLLSLFEAARWAPSAMNLQPWSFVLTSKDEPQAYERLFASLGERNQVWAQSAPVLALAVARREREPGKPNNSALYDTGQAVAHLSAQAGALDLYVHQMGGFDKDKARLACGLPEGFEPVVVLAIGYLGDPDGLPDDVRERELGPRARKPLSEVVFDGAWQVALPELAQPAGAD